ncbi:MAG: YiiX/YebB-like N1pC/P60 family cysteine hydrolase [Phycisphaeraceae bacterium]
MNIARRPRLSTRTKRIASAIALACVAVAAIVVYRVHAATDVSRVPPIALPDGVELRTGDIIIAGGVSMHSRVVMALTDDNKYSHVGLIENTPAGLFVIHAAPKGAGDGGAGDRVARIPLAMFLADRGYVAIKVVRLDGDAAGPSRLALDACAFASACVDRAVPFDNDFDIGESRRMYCSELVYLAYQHAGHDWPDTIVRSVSTMLVDGPVILPDAFTQCDALTTVWTHSAEHSTEKEPS